MVSGNEVRDYLSLFSGNTEAYGVTVVGEMKDGKMQSESRLIHKSLDQAVVERHLSGTGDSIGIAPICTDSTCNFAAIDIDDYKYDLQAVIRAIYDWDMPLVPCYSKSHKLHLYAFFSDSPAAVDVVEYMRKYLGVFGCSSKTEIFPKQTSVSSQNVFYSWINVPYFNASEETDNRKALDVEGNPLTLGEFIFEATRKKLSFKKHLEFFENFEYADAPFCVRLGVVLGLVGPGQRNVWLFNCGVFWKLKDEDCDLEQKLTFCNGRLPEPLSERELQSTVLKSFEKRTYYYQCASIELCDKKSCKMSEFGVDAKVAMGLDFGMLTKINTDPPYYEWVVNGQKMMFKNETELMGQSKFRELCLRQLRICPRRISDERWSKILDKACRNMEERVEDDDFNDFTVGSAFMGYLREYFQDRRMADNITQVFMGRVFEDTSTNEYVFTARSLMDYLSVTKGFRDFNGTEVRSRLLGLGAHKHGEHWRLPISVIPKVEKPELKIDLVNTEIMEQANGVF